MNFIVRSWPVFLLLASLSPVLAAGTEPATAKTGEPGVSPLAATAPAAQPWFDAIQGPLALSEPLANRLCQELARTLGNNQPDLSFLPADTKPRVLLLTCRTTQSEWPVTVFGTGMGIGAAAADAAQRAATIRDLVPAAGVKLDLVQHATRISDFELRKSTIPQPSLVGIAFSRASGFVFLPEAITAQGLVTPTKLLNLQRIEEGLLGNKDKDLGRFGVWQQIASFQGPQGLFLFESQSHYADGQTAALLFRGHRVLGALNRLQIEQSGRGVANFLLRHTGTNGAFQCPYPRWQTDEAGSESAADLAQALVALLEWHQVCPQKEIPGVVENGLAALLKNLTPFKPDAQAACIVEDYRSRLTTNALTAIALAKQGKLTRRTDRLKPLNQLGRYLLLQMQPDGSFVAERYVPSGNVRPAASDVAAAQAALALVHVYEATGESRYLDAAMTGIRFLLKSAESAKEGIRVPRDGWLMMALNDAYTYRRDKTLLPVAERMTIATLASQTLEPLFPDFLGCWENLPVSGDAAARTHGLFTAAQLLRDTRRELLAGKALEGAHLGLIFVLQCQVDSAVALNAPAPAAIGGAFRTHLLGYDAALAPQAQALLALAAALRAVPGGQEQLLPLSDAMRSSLQNTHAQVVSFPRCLPRKVELPEENLKPVLPANRPR